MEFIFEDIIYKYENGWIYWKHERGYYIKLCPVLSELEEILDLYTQDVRRTMLDAIVHGCCYGYSDGKKAKIQEFKNVFNLD